MAILLPFIAAIFLLLFCRNFKKFHIGWIVLLVPAILFILLSRKIPVVAKGLTLTHSTNWIPSYDINLVTHLDGLSMIFGLLITGIGSLVVIYSIYYLVKEKFILQFYIYLLLFMGSMLGVVFSDNIMILYVFWELTSISSFLLIAFWFQRKGSRYGARKALHITVFGGFAMLVGFLMLYFITGTFSLQEIIATFGQYKDHPLIPAIIILILLGAFTKSAQFPFHIWLPDAMEAPTPVSAYLHSATMVKAGLYLVARFFPLFSEHIYFFIIVSLFGIITLCWGSYMAVRQTDLKAILAFSTVSQLGMIMAMLGFGTEIAIFAAVFHILNHATFKGSLFMVAGIVDVQTGTRDIRKLGQLFMFMPITATLALFGTFSMAGIPLPFLNGFYSKELFFDSTLTLQQNSSAFIDFFVPAITILALIGSTFTFVYSMYLFFGVFIKKADTSVSLNKKPKEPPIGMIIAPTVLVFGVIIIGLVPNLFNRILLTHTAQSILPSAGVETINFWHGLSTPFIMSIIVVVVGALLTYFKK